MQVASLVLGIVAVASAAWSVSLAWARVEALEEQLARHRALAKSARLAILQQSRVDALRHLDAIAPRGT